MGVSLAKYRLFNVLCLLWNIYEGVELLRVYFIFHVCRYAERHQ